MDEKSLVHLESLGYEGVLLEMAKGDGRLGRPGSELREDIEHWLRLKESAIRDDREERTLSFAKDTNDIAKHAERWAMYAAIAAVIALIISIARSQN